MHLHAPSNEVLGGHLGASTARAPSSRQTRRAACRTHRTSSSPPVCQRAPPRSSRHPRGWPRRGRPAWAVRLLALVCPSFQPWHTSKHMSQMIQSSHEVLMVALLTNTRDRMAAPPGTVQRVRGRRQEVQGKPDSAWPHGSVEITPRRLNNTALTGRKVEKDSTFLGCSTGAMAS